MVQRVIHMLIAKQKQGLEKLAKRREAAAHRSTNNTSDQTQEASKNEESPSNAKLVTSLAKRPCHATKCRLLQAKGIVLKQQYCINGRSMCSGCNNEAAKQRKTLQLEQEILTLSFENNALAPLLELLHRPTSIKRFRQLFMCLPSFAPKKSREDCIFGAARYLANTFGFQLDKTQSANLLDEPLHDKVIENQCRQACFLCRCPTPTQPYTSTGATLRSFCGTCSFLIPVLHHDSPLSCRGCRQQESWKTSGAPCLACQFASIVHRNPFSKRYTTLQNVWLPLLDDLDTSSLSDCPTIPPSPQTPTFASPSSQE